MTERLAITLLGTGCPAVSTTRYGPANLIHCGDLTLLGDVGSGTTQRLVGSGTNGAAIDALLITHIHTDHLVDLYQFIISSWHQNRDRKQVIYGPPGIREFVDATMAVWAGERELRLEWEKRASLVAFDIEVHELDDEGLILDEAGGRISAVAVEHQPVEPAFGFIFESGGRKLVVSGDTRYCDNLVRAAQGADLVVHEVFVHGQMPVQGTRTEAGLANVAAYHTASTDVGKVAARAGAGCLLLTHIVPPDIDRFRLLRDARADFDGPVIVGEDLMTVDLVDRTVCQNNVTFALPSAESS